MLDSGDFRFGGKMGWYIEVLKKYAVFSGRAGRQEYWMFTLVNLVIVVVISIIGELIGLAPLVNIYILATFLPALGVGIRRLHDTGRSAWWLFIGLVPLIGAIAMIVFLVKDSDPFENPYGPDPKIEMD